METVLYLYAYFDNNEGDMGCDKLWKSDLSF